MVAIPLRNLGRLLNVLQFYIKWEVTNHAIRCTVHWRNRHPSSLQTSTIIVILVSVVFPRGVHPPQGQELVIFSQVAPIPPPFPFLHLNSLPFFFPPSLSYSSTPPKISWGLENAVSFPSRIRGPSPAANSFFFYTFWAFKTNLVATFLVFNVQCKWLFYSLVMWKNQKRWTLWQLFQEASCFH